MSIDANPAFPAARHEVARIGALLGEPSRAAILLALLDGTPRSAGDLARAARVTPQTASAHLAKRAETGDFATACPDWTEECSHLGGRVAEALTARLLELGWFKKVPRVRTLRLTPLGARGLARELGIAEPTA